MAKMADFRSHTSGGSACGSRATGFEKNGNETLMKGFLQISQTFTLINKGASRCHRITLSKWFHKEPLTEWFFVEPKQVLLYGIAVKNILSVLAPLSYFRLVLILC